MKVFKVFKCKACGLWIALGRWGSQEFETWEAAFQYALTLRRR